jgi:hypothetical protein
MVITSDVVKKPTAIIAAIGTPVVEEELSCSGGCESIELPNVTMIAPIKELELAIMIVHALVCSLTKLKGCGGGLKSEKGEIIYTQRDTRGSQRERGVEKSANRPV